MAVKHLLHWCRKTILSPIFHVNADDVEAVVYTVRLAIEFRQKFHQDVFIDLLGYRKYGHNESDEPRFTQPILYKIIEQHPDSSWNLYQETRAGKYADKINIAGIKEDITNRLEKSFEISKGIEKTDIIHFLAETWKISVKANPSDIEASPETGVDVKIT